MGFKDTKWAYTLDLTLAECAVLVAVCTMTDDRTHQTYASQETLARMSKLTRPTVNKTLGVLESRGLVTREKRHDESGQRKASLITANVGAANVGKANIGEANVGENESQRHPDAGPTSATPTAIGINQIDQPEGQPDVTAIALIPPMAFERFWEVWPRKDGRKAALAAWNAATKRASPELIVERATAYAQHPYRPPKQYVPHGATWLRGDRWNDPPPEPRELERRPTRTEQNLAFVAQLAAEQNAQTRGIAS